LAAVDEYDTYMETEDKEVVHLKKYLELEIVNYMIFRAKTD